VAPRNWTVEDKQTKGLGVGWGKGPRGGVSVIVVGRPARAYYGVVDVRG